MYDALLEGMQAEVLTGLATSRNRERAEIQRLLDRSLSSPEDLQQGGLVDHVAYEDDLPKLLGDQSRKARIAPLAQALHQWLARAAFGQVTAEDYHRVIWRRE